MRRATKQAERLGHNGIGCEHLLLGLLADEAGIAARVLAAHGVALEPVRRRVDQIVGDGWQNSRRWTYSPRANVVSRLAEVEAERLEQLPANDAHLLLAMITEGGGVPMTLLAELDVHVDRLREDVLTALDVPHDVRDTYLRQRKAYELAHQKAREQAQRQQ